MKFDALTDPISADEPCGPDLNAAMDLDYEEYYFSALGRLPDFFVQPGVERPDETKTPDRYFDTKSVDYRSEAREIEALLARSRDIRLLTLLAQWEILAGRLGPMADAIEAIAKVLEAFPNDAHPNLDNGPADRRDALEELNQSTTIIQPLMFLELCGSEEVTLRRINVANGKGTPLDNEKDLNGSDMMAALASDANFSVVEKTYAAVIKISLAIQSIETTCQSKTTSPFTPDLDRFKAVIAELVETLCTARPDLGKTAAGLAGAEALGDSAVANAYEMQLSVEGGAINIANIPRPTVVDHTHAKHLLEACEAYFCTHEPSSGALVLITQARLLIGQPMVEALRTLLPQKAASALVDFGLETGFQIDAERLYQLTQEATNAQQQRLQEGHMQEMQRQQQLEAEERQRQEEERRRLEAEQQQAEAQADQEAEGQNAGDQNPEDQSSEAPSEAPDATPTEDAPAEEGATSDAPPETETMETEIAETDQHAPMATEAHQPATTATQPASPATGSQGAPYPPYAATSPETALVATIAVEEYFRRKERSSPIPILLQRARNYMNMDFQSLVDELIPKPQEPS